MGTGKELGGLGSQLRVWDRFQGICATGKSVWLMDWQRVRVFPRTFLHPLLYRTYQSGYAMFTFFTNSKKREAFKENLRLGQQDEERGSLIKVFTGYLVLMNPAFVNTETDLNFIFLVSSSMSQDKTLEAAPLNSQVINITLFWLPAAISI